MRPALSIAILCAACAPPAAREQPANAAASGAAPIIEPGATVVLRVDRWLWAHPGDDRIRFREGGGSEARPRHRRFIAVGVRGAWIEITAPPPETAACVDSNPILAAHGLRVFARREALAQVATRPLAARFDDDTSIEIRAGVPIAGRADNGWARVALEDAAFAIPLDWEDVGDSYRPPPERGARVAGGDDRERDVAADAELLVGGAPIELDARADLSPVETTDGWRAEIDHRCFALRVAVSPGGVIDAGTDGFGLTGSGGAGGPFVKKGARVTWRDGTAAGETTEAIPVDPAWFEVAPDRRRACRRLEISRDGPPAERAVEICFDPSDVAGL